MGRLDYPVISRSPQSISVTSMTETAAQAIAVLVGVQPSHRPRAAESKSHGTATKSRIANSVPPTFARRALIQCPRTKCAQAVVIPQAGQGRPNNTTTVQGGHPNCRCVPLFRGSGSRPRATTSGTIRANPKMAADSRCSPESLARSGLLVPVTLIERKEGGR